MELSITCWNILFTNFLTWYKLGTYIVDSLWWIDSIDVVMKVTSWLFLKYFLVYNSSLKMLFTTQAMNLKVGLNKFCKRTVWFKNQNMFWEDVAWPSWSNINQLCLWQDIPNVSFHFISWEKTCKMYLVTSKRDFCLPKNYWNIWKFN